MLRLRFNPVKAINNVVPCSLGKKWVKTGNPLDKRAIPC